MAAMTAGPIAPIRLVLETPAPPAVTWAYLTEPERVAEWFTDASEVGQVGDTYRLDFGDGSVVEGRIEALTPGRRFAHGWSWLDQDPSAPTLVSWEVFPNPGGGSRVELVHEGWTEASADEALRDDHEAYWSGYLDDLRDVLEDAART
jgi:uncharacterized protein YndB with AHSA1/START domain